MECKYVQSDVVKLLKHIWEDEKMNIRTLNTLEIVTDMTVKNEK